MHVAIIRGDLNKFYEKLKDFDVNHRNSEGKSPLFLCIEHGHIEMFRELFKRFKGQIEMRSKDRSGNTALHIACKHQNLEAAKAIFDLEPELCLVQNFQGRSPFFIACQRKNLELVKLFE